MPTDIAGILTRVNAHRGWAGECRREFYDKRMNQEVIGDVLGDEFKGYIFKISGGNDKQGFPMKQGVMTSKRVRLLRERREAAPEHGRREHVVRVALHEGARARRETHSSGFHVLKAHRARGHVENE